MDDPWNSPWAFGDHGFESLSSSIVCSPPISPSETNTSSDDASRVPPPSALYNFLKASPWGDIETTAFRESTRANPSLETYNTASAWRNWPIPEDTRLHVAVSPLTKIPEKDKSVDGDDQEIVCSRQGYVAQPPAGCESGSASVSPIVNAESFQAPDIYGNGRRNGAEYKAPCPSAVESKKEKEVPFSRLNGDTYGSHPRFFSVFRCKTRPDCDVHTENIRGCCDTSVSVLGNTSGACNPVCDEETRQGSGVMRSSLEVWPSILDTHTSHEAKFEPSTMFVDGDARALSESQERSLSKVQSLVGLYDGLSEAAESQYSSFLVFESSEAPDRSLQKSHEHALLKSVDKSDVLGISSAGSLRQIYLPKGNTSETPISKASLLSRNSIACTMINKSSPHDPILSIHHKQIQYSFDNSKIDELFNDPLPETPDETKQDQGEGVETFDKLDAYVPDHIMKDSFTSISERKMWYRVSRQEAHRKRCFGDNKNRRPAKWVSSACHAATVRVVRQWMEADSFSAKPRLGRSGIKSSLFGWDSNSEPISLDEIYKKKAAHPSSTPFSDCGRAPPSGHPFSWAEEDSRKTTRVDGCGVDSSTHTISSSNGIDDQNNADQDESDYHTLTFARDCDSRLSREIEELERVQPAATLFLGKSIKDAKSGEIEDERGGNASVSPSANSLNNPINKRASLPNMEAQIPTVHGIFFVATEETRPEPWQCLEKHKLQSSVLFTQPATEFVTGIINSLPDLSYMNSR